MLGEQGGLKTYVKQLCFEITPEIPGVSTLSDPSLPNNLYGALKDLYSQIPNINITGN